MGFNSEFKGLKWLYSTALCDLIVVERR